jgi:hypothetical protein
MTLQLFEVELVLFHGVEYITPCHLDWMVAPPTKRMIQFFPYLPMYFLQYNFIERALQKVIECSC